MNKITGPCVISEATLRTRDVAPAFLNALYELGDDAAHRADEIRSEYHDVFVAIQTLDSFVGDCRGDDAGCLMETLFDALDEFAPEGTYFGLHEGDGACYGFWSNAIPCEECGRDDLPLHPDNKCPDCSRWSEGEDPNGCECDNTHEQNDTVCRWCWSRGRRKWNDPEVDV